MKLTGIVAVLITAAFAGPAHQGAQIQIADATAEQEVRAFQRELFAATQRHDRGALERLIADGFVFIHATGGLETRTQFLDNSAAGTLSSQSRESRYLDDELRVYDGHTAIRSVRSVLNEGKAGEVNLRTIHAYAKVGGRWQWLHGQSTRLATRPKAAVINPSVYDDYVGRYAINTTRTFTVTKAGDTLKGHATDRPPVELIPQSDTEFVCFDPQSNLFEQIIFVRGEGGRATHAVFRRQGEELWRAKRLQ